MRVRHVQGIEREYYDKLKVPNFRYCFSNNGSSQVKWQQMIGMSVLLSKVDRCVLFSSHLLLVWKMVVERSKRKEDV